MPSNKLQNQSAYPADWSSFYNNLQSKGKVPNASTVVVDRNNAIFRGMYQDLSDIKTSISQSGFTPGMTTIYADVLVIPDFTNWLLSSSGLVIFARRIEVSGSATVMLDYRQTNTAQLVVFASEMTGTLTASAIKSSQDQPVLFSITQSNVSPGISINNSSSTPGTQPLTLQQGIGFQLPDDMQLYLSNSFIYGSLLYDQNQALALAIFLWVKGWAAQNAQMEELFYRSTSLATLLNAQINATANGAAFVPYLTSTIYTTLADAFAADAGKYESDYQQLYVCKTLTDENIEMAKTMVANSQSEITYVTALLQQANANYTNAINAATKAQTNFNNQKIVVDAVAADFQQIGIPDYTRDKIIEAVFSLITAVVTFGAAIAAMAMGDEAAGPAAAKSAINSVEAVANAADTGVQVAKTASNLADTMAKLKKLIEGLKKVYELAKAVKEVAENITEAKAQMKVIQDMQETTDGADLSAADGWKIYKLQTDNVMKEPVDEEIGFAKEYKEALDILVIYGQALSAAQLAVINAGQQVAAISFQLHYAQQKQTNLQSLVNSLQTGEAPVLAMMQQFYQKYLDAKSSLFAALKSYQASYFYWALRPSTVAPQIVDPVSNLNAGIQDITKIAMDTASALSQFDPPPQQLENTLFVITDATILKQLQTTGHANWILPLDEQSFATMDRVRLSTIRIWIEGLDFSGANNAVNLIVSTDGNYFDRYEQVNYQFNSKPLVRTFKYMVSDKGLHPDWRFNDGSYGFVQIDGAVDKEVAYAYFEPTPFSEWSISLTKQAGLDYSKVSKITMYFEGSAIGETAAASKPLLEKTSEYA